MLYVPAATAMTWGSSTTMNGGVPLLTIPAPYTLIATPHCDGGTFTPASQTLSGATVAVLWSFTATNTSGSYPITWTFGGTAAAFMSNWRPFRYIIITKGMSYPCHPYDLLLIVVRFVVLQPN